jgi:predicted unusual protein kinase regulating ubiquinone biosynthesis (AarF/ABC1/UbiB family)
MAVVADRSGPPTGRVRRTATPAALLLRAAAGTALAKARTRKADPTIRNALLDERLAASAEHAARTMGQMKGAVMKIGQLLSFVDADLVPEAYRGALAALQADAPPMSTEAAGDMIEAELGARPEAIFDWFSPQPIAAASIGQVHLARLADGSELAVKVQYPGIAEAIDADLRNGALLSFIGTMAQTVLRDLVVQVDMKAILEEIKDRITEELDYRIEIANQQEFAGYYRDHPTIHIPEVVPELSTRRVLTMEYVDAMRYSAALAAPKELRDAWGETICRFVFGSIYHHHVFNADPHPGNYLFHEDGRVTFLDFGCVKRWDAAWAAGWDVLFHAVMRGDPEEILQGAVLTGGIKDMSKLAPAARDEIVEMLRRSYWPRLAPQPFTYTKEWATSLVADLTDLRLGDRGINSAVDLPKDTVFLLRINAGLTSVLAGLEATVDWDVLGPDIWPEN